ncbi:MAG: acyl-CoA dehydrogenase [Euryarchaeota archaeon]|nr:acyl-CoA dehydrogenase [Euryarchaeota archaeon]|tara:strand:+ start:4065 stop:5216 length:1152 start_codon:yes stop_codon:yes gene_type:complete
MVDFTLTEEQDMLVELARMFADDELIPNAEEWDRNGVFPEAAIHKARELGLLNCTIPQQYGGLGLSYLDEVMINEELGRGDPGFATITGVTMLACHPLIYGGTEEQKHKFLRRVCDGEISAYCVTEPGAGSDVRAMTTTAILDGDDYVLNGAKMWIGGAGHANWFYVLAKTSMADSHHSLSGFIVEADSPGLSVGKKEEKMGQRSSDTRSVSFDNVRVPKANLVGGVEGGGWLQAMVAFDRSRPMLASHALGNARGAMEEAWQYANERHTFGKAIFHHQSISFMLADMSTKIEGARLLAYKAADLLDKGEPATLAAAHAKRYAADIGMEVTTDSVQIFGGYGYSEEFPAARRMRGAKIYQIFGGTSQIQRLIISREINKHYVD